MAAATFAGQVPQVMLGTLKITWFGPSTVIDFDDVGPSHPAIRAATATPIAAIGNPRMRTPSERKYGTGRPPGTV
jgi:hypothetical protein